MGNQFKQWLKNQGYYIIHSFIHSYLHPTLNEHLLCARYWGMPCKNFYLDSEEIKCQEADSRVVFTWDAEVGEIERLWSKGKKL